MDFATVININNSHQRLHGMMDISNIITQNKRYLLHKKFL